MVKYVLGRALQALGVLWAAYTVTFVILYLLPSNPVELQLGAAGIESDKLTAAQLAAAKAKYGLNDPVLVQYVHHLWGALHGDFGISIAQQVPVSTLIAQRIGTTLVLAIVSAVLSVIVGTALAYLASLARWEPVRIFLSRLPSLGASVPQFFTALLLIQLFSFSLGWLPSTGSNGWQSLVLPSITISVLTASVLAQILMRSFDETLDQAYVTTARAKGLSRSTVQLRHVLRNAIIPAVTIMGVIVGLTVTSSIVVETVFSREGIGKLAQESVLSQDVPVVLGVVTVASALFVLVNLLIDLLYPWLDPRISYLKEGAS